MPFLTGVMYWLMVMISIAVTTAGPGRLHAAPGSALSLPLADTVTACSTPATTAVGASSFINLGGREDVHSGASFDRRAAPFRASTAEQPSSLSPGSTLRRGEHYHGGGSTTTVTIRMTTCLHGIENLASGSYSGLHAVQVQRERCGTPVNATMLLLSQQVTTKFISVGTGLRIHPDSAVANHAPSSSSKTDDTAAAAQQRLGSDNPWGLPELLHIDWRRITDLPIGVEDNSGGFIDRDTLVTGFGMGCENPAAGETDGCFLSNCSSVPASQKKQCYSRPGAQLNVNTYGGNPRHIAWFSRTYAINTSASSSLSSTSSDRTAWTELPLPPLAPRQGTCGAADPASRSFYVAGGWSEWTPAFPCGLVDGARLQQSGQDGSWQWTKLPDLPHPVVFAGMTVAAGGNVFVFGADRYATAGSAGHKGPACGSVAPMLYELDLDGSGGAPSGAAAGWTSYAYPGSATNGALASTGKHIFLVSGGGINGDEPIGGNWKFELSTKAWSRLADSPVRQIAGFANHNNAIFNGRYMILVGGCEINNYKKGAAPKDGQQCTVGGTGFGTCSCPCKKSSNGTADVRNVSAIEPGKCGVPLGDGSLPMVYGEHDGAQSCNAIAMVSHCNPLTCHCHGMRPSFLCRQWIVRV